MLNKTYLIILRWKEGWCGEGTAIAVYEDGELERSEENTGYQCRAHSNTYQMSDVPVFSVVLGKAKPAYRRANSTTAWVEAKVLDEVNLNQVSIHSDLKTDLETEVDGLKEWERMKLIQKYRKDGVTFDYFIRDVDGTNNFYCLNSWDDCGLWPSSSRNDYTSVRDLKTSMYVSGELQQFLKNAAQEQWDFFKDKVNQHEGEADINAVGYYFASQAIAKTEHADHFFNGKIGELIMFSDELSNDEVTQIREKLIEKWK